MEDVKKSEATSTPQEVIEAAMAETVEGGIDFLRSVDPSRAKVVFVMGVMIYLVLSFIHYGRLASLKALESKEARLYVAIPKPLKPTPPIPPLEPNPEWFAEGEKSPEYLKLKKQYDEDLKVYEKAMEEYRTKKLPQWQRQYQEWDHEMKKLIAEQKPVIEEQLKKKRAYLNAWAYINHIIRFIAALLMGFGAMVLLFHGNPYERAVSLFILGYILIGILKV